MRIHGYNTSFLDYPNKDLSLVIFTVGCNFNCGYCHNSLLINTKEVMEEMNVFEYLKNRSKWLSGIVISGGEPTIQKDLKFFIKKLKTFNLPIKLDTNGSNPDVLEKIITDIDFIAMDIKHIFEKYNQVTSMNVNINNIKRSIEIVKNIEHQFRITLIKGLHSEEDVIQLKKQYKNLKLQRFLKSVNVRDENLKEFTEKEFDILRKL